MAKVYIDNKKSDNDSVHSNTSEQNEIKDEKIIERPNYLVGSIEIWALGITTVIGGQYYGWNTNLTSGFGSYFIGLFLMGTAYIILILCLAEIGSAFYFSGGCYGLARVVLGFYPGFLVGYLQLFEFLIYASSAMIYVSQVICQIANISNYYQPLFWFICYASATFFSVKGGRTMWNFINVLAGISVLLIIIYCLGSLRWVNISKYAPLPNNSYFSGGMSAFLGSLASGTTVGFGGIESLALIVSYMKVPQKNFQVGAISSVITLFVCNIVLLIVMVSLPPGIIFTSQQAYPMNVGYNLIFQWPSQISSLLVIPANYAMGYGFFLPYGKLLQCLADSNLAPHFLGLYHETNPGKAIMICSFFGFLLCILGLFDSSISAKLNNIAIFCGFLTYFSILVGHIVLNVKHKHIERSFKSPLGIVGSIYALLVFLLGSVGSMGFLGDHYVTIIATVIIVIVLTIYYYTLIAKTQKLSSEEHKSLFKLHVINFNNRKNKRMIKSSNQSNSKGSKGSLNNPQKQSYNSIISPRAVANSIKD